MNVRRRSAYTLVEIVLTLALTAVLVALVAQASFTFFNTSQRGINDIAEAQVARSVLFSIASDLRSAVRYQEVDLSSLQSLGGASMSDIESAAGDMLEGSGIDADALSGAAGGSSGSDSESSSDDESAADSLASAVDIPPIAGIYGNQYELQIDVSRLPRLDEYQPELQSSGAMTKIPSDVKTVVYYVRPSNGASPSAGVNDAAASDEAAMTLGASLAQSTTGGLVRRGLDRAVTAYAVSNGNSAMLDASGDLLAPEIVAAEFAYFDGAEWFTDWDTEAKGGLPLAVEIAIGFAPPVSETSGVGSTPSAGATTLATLDPEHVYRIVVHIPSAEATAESLKQQPEVEEEKASSSDASSNSSTSNDQNSGGNDDDDDPTSGNNNNNGGGGRNPTGGQNPNASGGNNGSGGGRGNPSEDDDSTGQGGGGRTNTGGGRSGGSRGGGGR